MTSVWQSALLPLRSTIQDVILNLDESALQIVLVVSEDNQLIGTITDGDIRRGLLRGLDLNSSIESIVFRESLIVTPQMSKDMVIQLMQANKIHQLPIVDDRRRVVGLYLWDEILTPSQRPNVFIIMAGGKGTRLMPHTENCPKPLLPVAGKPMLEHIISRAKSEGFHKFFIAIHYLGHMIEEYFGDGSRFDVDIEYIKEEEPLGTAGALSLLTRPLKEPFLVTNGDVMTDIHYGELLDFHVVHDAQATMAVRLHEWQHPFGVVKTKGVDIVAFEEKPIYRSHVNAGIYALNPDALFSLEAKTHCDMPTLFSRLGSEGYRTIVYPMHEPWIDVGRPGDLEKVNSIEADM
ncbi:nucleotidyltransferase family protein [Leptospira santarosai]|uniref:Nucleotidyl transferase n=1 Tax=Leptospira santarosai serovar Shermani str. LT 821 TaxID=758847 RepID=K8XXN8_9LEPT|nr:nucleotidyltransferase family protein [Leptospira santarosai]EKT85641.1 nucleotidyl transferase [Leptospira santarosai serovar Shermani str. LT 821]EMO15895.1 CBS domain protein [Leptospira santarosai str. CBC523]EMO32999.1 CBS domain protein [Leptospira santarosai str. HAI821]EPG82579.1 CBS domain protein [Leptospira santarosai serovar Shermani str. 1342KT]MDI7207026.1 nucleotidyltransferase family protein [Leptospira santarosai]